MKPGTTPDAPLRIILRDHTDSIADYVMAAVGHNGDGLLIPAQALAEIAQIARHLPGAITDFFGFECPLGSHCTGAGFGICCRTSHISQEILAGNRLAWDPFAQLADSAVWQRIREFCREWAKPESALHGAVHNIWFEFDVGRTRSQLPVPSVFLGTHQIGPSSIRTGTCGSRDESPWLMGLALPILLGGEMRPAVHSEVERALEALPANVRVFQVGSMLARESQAVRLCLRGIGTWQIPEYLEAIGWEGGWHLLEDLLEQLGQTLTRVDLAVDITDTVLPKIGLECYPDVRADSFLEFLALRELCTQPEVEALRAWPRTVDESAEPERWPGNLLSASCELGGALHSAFVRKVHHVKLDYRPGLPLRAKAYLGVHHKWITAPSSENDSEIERS